MPARSGPVGSVGFEPQPDTNCQRLIWLEWEWLDRLNAMRADQARPPSTGTVENDPNRPNRWNIYGPTLAQVTTVTLHSSGRPAFLTPTTFYPNAFILLAYLSAHTVSVLQLVLLLGEA